MAANPLLRACCVAHRLLSTTKNGVPLAAMQKGYGQYCPIAKGAEMFAERWTPLIVRNPARRSACVWRDRRRLPSHFEQTARPTVIGSGARGCDRAPSEPG